MSLAARQGRLVVLQTSERAKNYLQWIVAGVPRGRCGDSAEAYCGSSNRPLPASGNARGQCRIRFGPILNTYLEFKVLGL